MTARKWIRCSYQTTDTIARCERCNVKFEYRRVWKPKRFCPTCARLRHLEQMRTHCREYRRLHRIRLEAAR